MNNNNQRRTNGDETMGGWERGLKLLSTCGSLAALNDRQRSEYYSKFCQEQGLDPHSVPFEWLNLNGKVSLYAKKNAADQLRMKHKISLTTETKIEAGFVIVTATATLPSGRTDSDIGVVEVGKGSRGANGMMTATTKAKRRVTLSITGLGMLDETEVDTIPSAKTMAPNIMPQIEKPVVPEKEEPEDLNRMFSDAGAYANEEASSTGVPKKQPPKKKPPRNKGAIQVNFPPSGGLA